MKFFVKTAALAGLAVGLFGFIGADNPTKALADLREFANQTMSAAQSGGRKEYDEAHSKILAKAKDAVSGVDAAKVEPKDGLTWAQLFMMAEQRTDARTAAERFLTSSPSSADKFSAQTMIASACSFEKNYSDLYNTLDRMEPSTPAEGRTFAMYVMSFSDEVAKAKGLDSALQLLDRADTKVDPKETDAQGRKIGESYVYQLTSARVDLLRDAGKKDEALKAADAGIGRLPADSKMIDTLKTLKNQVLIIGTPAPTLAAERGYGDFPGLDKLKGKVVLLDFFAHWCGPCKAAFPEMRGMYSDLHAKGLEVVGVTTYYGYYGKEQGLSKDVEYAKMADFIKEFELPWSVQYGDRANFKNYGVTGIPHVVVIDKKGVVRDIKIGYNPSGFPAFRAEIEKLLGE